MRLILFGLLLLSCVGCKGLRNERLLREQEGGASNATSTPTATPTATATATASATASAANDEADARKRAWTGGGLTGRDNNVAAFRLVTITPDEKLGFKLFVKNEFGLTCGLAFGPDGRPAETTTPCVGSDGWHAKEPRLSFTCTQAANKENCHARYTLADKSGFSDPATLELVRSL